MKSMATEAEKFRSTLAELDVIRDIEEYASKTFNAVLKLCYPRSISDRKSLHFIVSSQETISFFSLSELSIFIQDKIDFEDVYVQAKDNWKQNVYEELFVDEIDYSVARKKEIEQFLDKHYPKFLSYQQRIKECGLPFFEFEKMEMEESEMLGKAILDTCQREVESHSPTDEAQIAALLMNITRLATERGFECFACYLGLYAGAETGRASNSSSTCLSVGGCGLLL